ncbi:phage holin family protein [Micromonospora sp. NPDC093244]|uniref:phage holin family protein n=1 Tax=Micromonospora sp. NPDC093244 TaxID=3155071 RepID=UPI003436E7DE
MPPPSDEQRRPPKRVEAVPGTPYGVVYLDVAPVTSGLAVGALVAGVASVLVSLLVVCFGVAFANEGGAWASGAFAVLGVLAGVAAIVAGLLGRRQIGRPTGPPAVRFTGRGLAVAGISCGAAGALFSLLGLGLSLLISLT